MDTRVEFILYVKDQHASRDFYAKVLALEPMLDVPGMTEFLLSEGVKLGLMPEKGIQKILQDKTPDPSSGNGIPRCELYLYVEDLKEYYNRSLDAGAKEISAIMPRDWGDEVCYVGDLDGHVLAFARKIH